MIRDTWYFTDDQGGLVSTLWLTADEYAMRTDKERLTRDKPADVQAATLDELALWKASAKRMINSSRMEAINAPISVGNLLIDGDAVAREAVATKRREIEDCKSRGVSCGICVWRDAADVTHSFDLAAYETWLQDAAIAMSQRATRVMARSWDRKSQVDAATTIEQVRQIMGSSADSEIL